MPVGLAAAAFGVCVLVLAPLVATVVSALHGGLVEAARLLLRPLVARLLVNSLALAAASALACAAIGTAAAWLVECTDLPGRKLWAVLAPLPLAIPAFITSYAWLSVSPAFQGGLGAALVVISACYPLVYLPVAATLRGLDPALDDAARSMGCGPWRSFLRVTLPQLRPALLGGMLLVTLNVLTEFGAFALLRFRTFTTEIYSEYMAGFAIHDGALLACVLVALCIVCLVAEARLRGRRSYARIGAGVRRPVRRQRLGSARYPALVGMLGLGIVTLGLPVAMTVYWLTRHDAAGVAAAGVSAGLLIHATLHSLGYGLAAGVLATLLALPVTLISTRYRHPFITLMEGGTYLPQSLPGIVVGLALVTLSLHLVFPLYQSALLLVIGYAIVFLPLAVVSLRATLVQLPPDLVQVARGLGKRPLVVLWRVVLPLAAPGLGAAIALVFIAVCTELTTTLLLLPIGAQTLATRIWAESSTFAFAAAAPYAALLMGISMLATWLLASRFGRTPIGHSRSTDP